MLIYIICFIASLSITSQVIGTIESSIIPVDFVISNEQNNAESLDLYHSDYGFIVKRNRKIYMVNPGSIDKRVRNYTNEQLISFLNIGYLQVSIINHDSISIQSKVIIQTS